MDGSHDSVFAKKRRMNLLKSLIRHPEQSAGLRADPQDSLVIHIDRRDHSGSQSILSRERCKPASCITRESATPRANPNRAGAILEDRIDIREGQTAFDRQSSDGLLSYVI
jgi:hypothetical protein